MRRAIVALLMLWLGMAGVALADPVTLTSGGFSAYGSATSDRNFALFELFSSEFSASGSGRGGAPNLGGFGLGPIDFSGSFSLFALDGLLTVGDQTLRGVASASLTVTAPPIVVGQTPIGTFIDGETPFTATGLFQFFPRRGAPPIFTRDLEASGTLGFSARSIGGAYLTQFVGFSIEPPESASPTPEPASLLLLGTGVVAAWRSRRLRRP